MKTAQPACAAPRSAGSSAPSRRSVWRRSVVLMAARSRARTSAQRESVPCRDGLQHVHLASHQASKLRAALSVRALEHDRRRVASDDAVARQHGARVCMALGPPAQHPARLAQEHVRERHQTRNFTSGAPAEPSSPCTVPLMNFRVGGEASHAAATASSNCITTSVQHSVAEAGAVLWSKCFCAHVGTRRARARAGGRGSAREHGRAVAARLVHLQPREQPCEGQTQLRRCNW